MLLAMNKLHASGMPNLKPDAFTYTAVRQLISIQFSKIFDQISAVINLTLSCSITNCLQVIDAYAKSGLRGASSRADQLLDEMEAKYLAGDMDLRPNTFTYVRISSLFCWIHIIFRSKQIVVLQRSYNCSFFCTLERSNQCISQGTFILKKVHIHHTRKQLVFLQRSYNFLLFCPKSGEPGAAARAERVLHNMVNRHRHGASEDVKPTTINFNSGNLLVVIVVACR